MSSNRKQRAIEMRDLALPRVAKLGRWKNAKNGALMLEFDSGELRLLYRGPFQRLPEGSSLNLSYGLDIWFRHKKVLNIEWHENGTIHLASYKPGEWEDQLLQIGAARGVLGHRQGPVAQPNSGFWVLLDGPGDDRCKRSPNRAPALAQFLNAEGIIIEGHRAAGMAENGRSA